jgi:hypothetical protein
MGEGGGMSNFFGIFLFILAGKTGLIVDGIWNHG